MKQIKQLIWEHNWLESQFWFAGDRQFSTKKLNKDEISQLYLFMLRMLVFKHRV